MQKKTRVQLRGKGKGGEHQAVVQGKMRKSQAQGKQKGTTEIFTAWGGP